MPKNLIIFGSSRNDGGTKEAVEAVFGNRNVPAIDLLTQNISYYDYNNAHENDDFFAVIEEMTKADKIIFATPVYWYTMSAIMKTLFDRFTDLITVKKEPRKMLKGKECYVISCGADEKMPICFEEPFSATCNYLGMEYKGCFYYSTKIAHGEKQREINAQRELAAAFGENF